MNKRSFVKLCSALMGGHSFAPLLAWAGSEKLKNWAENLEYSTDNLYRATSLAQVQEFVKSQPSLKVLGTRHCFNRIADSTRQFISVKEMVELVELNATSRTVTIKGGM